MTVTRGTLVVSQHSLSHNQDGRHLQRSEPDAAVQSGTEIDRQSLENFILKSVVEGLIFYIISGDHIKMAIRRAEYTCKIAGLAQEDFEPIFQTVLNNFTKTTEKNPLHSMF
jgi:hypothetical protein